MGCCWRFCCCQFGERFSFVGHFVASVFKVDEVLHPTFSGRVVVVVFFVALLSGFFVGFVVVGGVGWWWW